MMRSQPEPPEEPDPGLDPESDGPELAEPEPESPEPEPELAEPEDGEAPLESEARELASEPFFPAASAAPSFRAPFEVARLSVL